MKNILLTIMFLSSLAIATGQDKASGPDKDLSGFSGYSWGSSYDFINADMAMEGYDLIQASSNDLWYKGEILGKRVDIVYYFKKQVLTSGMWVFDEVDPKAYWKVNEFLRKTYNSQVKLRIRGDVLVEAEMTPPGTDSWIVHLLDIERDQHIVNYYYQDGE